jgi:hypothetical protein
VALVGGLALLVAAAPAAATTSTLKRSLENLTQFPFDIATAPVVAGKTIYENMNSIEDSPGVRIAYPIPGFFFNTMVQVGGGLIRGVTGLIELVPGVVLLFSESEMDPLYDPVEDNPALYENGGEPFRVKLGVDYTGGG